MFKGAGLSTARVKERGREVATGDESELVSHKVFLQSFGKIHRRHKFVNSFFISAILQDKLTDVWGG